jgi:hypothetical protein
MTTQGPADRPSRPVYTGPVLDGAGAGLAGPGAESGVGSGAVAYGRQLLEIVTGAVRGVAVALRASATAGLVAAIVITAICEPAFDMRWWTALILLVVVGLPALEVAVHRWALVRVWGDAGRLERRARGLVSSVGEGAFGAAGDFAERMSALRTGQGATGRQGLGAVRSAMGLRDVAGAVPGLAGVLLLPLRRQALVLTAACTALCWVLLVVGIPITAIVGLVAALAR